MFSLCLLGPFPRLSSWKANWKQVYPAHLIIKQIGDGAAEENIRSHGNPDHGVVSQAPFHEGRAGLGRGRLRPKVLLVVLGELGGGRRRVLEPKVALVELVRGVQHVGLGHGRGLRGRFGRRRQDWKVKTFLQSFPLKRTLVSKLIRQKIILAAAKVDHGKVVLCSFFSGASCSLFHFLGGPGGIHYNPRGSPATFWRRPWQIAECVHV